MLRVPALPPFLIALGLSAWFAAAPAHAGTFAAAARGASTGIGPELSLGLGATTRVRLALGAHDLERDVTVSGVDYDGDLELRSALALLDWHPGGGGFRVSVGLSWNDNVLHATAPLAELFADDLDELARRGIDIRGLDLGRARGEARTEQLGPFLGVGWGSSPRAARGVFVTFDIGAHYQGRPESELRAETTLPIDDVPGARLLLDQLIAREEAELDAEIEDYRIFPVVALGVGYRF